MNTSDLSPDRIYHIATAIAWQEALQQESYVHPSLFSEGFIHCSYREQVDETLRLHFKGQTNLVLLEIDPTQLAAELKVESSRNGELFPHLYGPLNLDAAIIQTTMNSGSPWLVESTHFGGRFISPISQTRTKFPPFPAPADYSSQPMRLNQEL